MTKTQIASIVLALFACSASDLGAQLATPNARSFGFAGSYSARARGWESSFWNPANLGSYHRLTEIHRFK